MVGTFYKVRFEIDTHHRGAICFTKYERGSCESATDIKDPVIGFIFGSKGLMYNLTLEGSKFTKLDKTED